MHVAAELGGRGVGAGGPRGAAAGGPGGRRSHPKPTWSRPSERTVPSEQASTTYMSALSTYPVDREASV